MNKFLSIICALAILTVTGTGTVTAQPDHATINLTIDTMDTSALANALAEHGVTQSDIQSTWFSIYGKDIHNQLTILIRNLDNIDQVISTATEMGASNIHGVQFGIDDNSKAYNEALAKAVENAKQKATQLSDLTGLGELQITSIKEISHPHHAIHHFHRNAEPTTATVEITFKAV